MYVVGNTLNAPATFMSVALTARVKTNVLANADEIGQRLLTRSCQNLNLAFKFRMPVDVKFPFKRKGLPSCSASLHVKAKKYTCDSDFPTLPSFFFPYPKHDQTFYCELKRKLGQLGRK